MWTDRVSNQGPLAYESGALPIALRGLAVSWRRGSLCVGGGVLAGIYINFDLVLLLQEFSL